MSKIQHSNNIYLSLIKTLSYSQVFNYPLKFNEIWKYLISDQKVSKSEVKELLNNTAFISHVNNYYFLRNKETLISYREERQKISKQKMKKARKIISILSFIPTIRFIGLSGSLALNNSKKDDDIDLFVITNKNTLWITRFMVNFVLNLLNVKRGREEKKASNKFCPNMFLPMDNLLISKQNIFTAHEVAQLKVLVNKNNTFERFLYENLWVAGFLPNAVNQKKLENKIKRENLRKFFNLFSYIFLPIELIAYAAQAIYMLPHKTNETVGLKIAKFHPKKRGSLIVKYKANYREACGNLSSKNDWKRANTFLVN